MVRPVLASPREIGQLIELGRGISAAAMVVLDGAVLGDTDEILRRELQNERHYADLDIQALQRRFRLVALERSKLEYLDALLLRGGLQHIRLRARLLGSAKHARHFVAAREKRVQHRFAEILLSDDGEFHQAAFLGGRLNAPAFFRVEIFSF